MRIIFAIMILAAAAFAQDQDQPRPAVAARACGPEDADFKVKLDDSRHTPAAPEPGKARIYFVQEIEGLSCIGSCVKTKIGINGAWVGAMQRNSYFSVSVDPGEHHLCATPGHKTVLAHITAEAGKSYYFRAHAFINKTEDLFDFEPIDSDEAEYLIARSQLSVSQLRISRPD
jgi:hypothetical protein